MTKHFKETIYGLEPKYSEKDLKTFRVRMTVTGIVTAINEEAARELVDYVLPGMFDGLEVEGDQFEIRS